MAWREDATFGKVKINETLEVVGNATMDGNLTVTGQFIATGTIFEMSRETLAAAGSADTDAAVISKQITVVTGADNAKGVALPAAGTAVGPYFVVNSVANKSLLVYPLSGGNDNINGLAEDVAFVLAPGRAAWFSPTSATQWYVEAVGGVKAKVLSGTYTVPVEENGCTYYLNAATEFVSTLPAPFLGASYEFIVGAAPSGASYTVVSGSSANIIKGLQNSVAGDAGDSGTADDTITFVDGQALAADRVSLRSDGTSWFAYAVSKVAAGITFTQAS